MLKTQQAFDAGFERRYDAILIDEGQDFTLGWWNLLREHALEPDGEMLLVTDPTQDIYDKRTLANEERMVGAGFTGPWTELKGSYRMPTDMVQLANTFAEQHIEGERLTATRHGGSGRHRRDRKPIGAPVDQPRERSRHGCRDRSRSRAAAP